MKKIITVTLCIVLVLLFAGCGKNGDTSKVEIDYGASSIYSKEEIDSAIEIIKKQFALFEGCELHRLSYMTDIAFILSIRPILKFSRHRLENLLGYCLGRIMQHYYRLKRRQLATGMRKKPQNRLGVSVLCRGIFLLSIITVCSKLRKKSL